MALYVSAGRRQRRFILITAAVAVVALALGWIIGLQQAPSIDESVATVRAEAADLATGVERLDIEYEQVLTGGGDTVEAGVLAPLTDLRAQLQSTLESAPWVPQRDRDAALDAFAAVKSGASSKVPLEEFQALIGAAGDQVRSTFGITG